ncbi:DUF3592 domain-containing protein [Streptomyces sp. NPDC126497]|uniref:DUF3592 domain-containing protein n=1 Tax=Streptomyces sp. NPDC126497 TaxID=3155313 RepID=UPI00332D7EC7
MDFVPLVVLFGVFFIAPCLAILWRDVPLMRRGVKCEGVCVAIHRNFNTAKPSVTCEFEFTGDDGKVARIRTTPQNYPLAEVGETRTLLYLPSKPQKARVATDLSVGSALFGLAVVAAISVALVLIY